jgi:hypothetical protein
MHKKKTPEINQESFLVGRAGQLSNQFLQDIIALKDFLIQIGGFPAIGIMGNTLPSK